MYTIFKSAGQRRIRVFVSSTFTDLEKERDYLVKVIFPQVRKFCQERNIEFIEIDLRWGITEEESKEGKVIEVCLKEIERSRPFFIGILNGRYGWVPDSSLLEKQKDLLTNFPWIEKDISDEISITEMEIQYGVLRNPDYLGLALPHAFFYLREPQPSDPLQSELYQKKLEKLKNLLLSQSNFPVTRFLSPKDLGDAILEQLINTISEEYPRHIQTSAEKAREEHIDFANSRLKVYVNDPDIFNVLDRHAEGEGAPLVITGTSGMGKTALLANWLRQYNEKHPDVFVFFHFVGSSADSTNYLHLIRRLLEEIKAEFEIEEPIPSGKEEMIKAIPGFWAATNVSGKRWILIIDGINQLEDEDKALLMGWFPSFIPANIRVIISSQPGITYDALMRRNYNSFSVPELNIHYRKTLINEFLLHYGKKLTVEQNKMISRVDIFRSPLILVAFLEELRIFGSHEKLSSFLMEYANLNTYDTFFRKILSRIEKDFTFNASVKAGNIFSMIWASRKGLSEKEIMEISGIRPIEWSQLYLAAEFHLINRGGFLNFSHDFFRQAVEKEYLALEANKVVVFDSLIEHFLKDKYSMRSMSELPHLFGLKKDYYHLLEYMTDPAVFLTLFDRDKNDFLRLCIPLREIQGFENQFSINWKNNKYCKRNLFETGLKAAGILNELGYYNQTIVFLKRLVQRTGLKNLPDERKEKLYFLLGSTLRNHGEYSQAIKFLEECYRIRVKHYKADHILCGEVLTFLGFTYNWMGKLGKADEALKKAHRIWKKNKMFDSPQIAASYNHMGIVAYDMGEYKKSILLYNKSLKIRLSLFGDLHPQVAECYNNIGLAYLDLENYSLAKQNFDKSLAISLTLLGEDHPDTSTDYCNIAHFYAQIGDMQSALIFNEKSLLICREFFGDDNMETAILYTNIGDIYGKMGEFEKTLECYKKNLDACVKSVGMNNYETGNAMVWIGDTLCELGNSEEAAPYFKKGLEILKSTLNRNNPSMASAYRDYGKFCLKTGDYPMALEYINESLKIYKNVKGVNSTDYASSLEILGHFFQDTGDYPKAETALIKALRIKIKKLGENHYEVTKTRCSMADLLKKMGQSVEARKLYQEAINFYSSQHFDSLCRITLEKLNRDYGSRPFSQS